MKITYKLEIGFAGCNEEGEIELPDDMGDHEIDLHIGEMAMEYAQMWVGDTRLFSEEEWEEGEEQFFEGVYGYWEKVE